MIEPVILENKIFKLLGCVFYGDPFHEAEEWSYENEIGKLWNRFMTLYHKYASLMKKICVDSNIAYELHLEPEEYMKTRNYYVLVGVEVDTIAEVPLEMFVKVLPKLNYVVFTTTLENKLERGGYIYKTWLPEKGYEQIFPYLIQMYDQKRYKGLEHPESEIDWYIPVKKSISRLERKKQ
ncbi:MAG: GyrI-like domain-containing protein [Candidatus Hodarchaeota archaeon]